MAYLWEFQKVYFLGGQAQPRHDLSNPADPNLFPRNRLLGETQADIVCFNCCGLNMRGFTFAVASGYT